MMNNFRDKQVALMLPVRLAMTFQHATQHLLY